MVEHHKKRQSCMWSKTHKLIISLRSVAHFTLTLSLSHRMHPHGTRSGQRRGVAMGRVGWRGLSWMMRPHIDGHRQGGNPPRHLDFQAAALSIAVLLAFQER